MLKRDELADPASCLNRAADDEPLLVLRANDPLVPDLIRQWVSRYLESKFLLGELTDARKAKAMSAHDLAIDCEEWRAKHVKP